MDATTSGVLRLLVVCCSKAAAEAVIGKLYTEVPSRTGATKQ